MGKTKAKAEGKAPAAAKGGAFKVGDVVTVGGKLGKVIHVRAATDDVHVEHEDGKVSRVKSGQVAAA